MFVFLIFYVHIFHQVLCVSTFSNLALTGSTDATAKWAKLKSYLPCFRANFTNTDYRYNVPRLWNVNSGACLLSLVGHTKRVLHWVSQSFPSMMWCDFGVLNLGNWNISSINRHWSNCSLGWLSTVKNHFQKEQTDRKVQLILIICTKHVDRFWDLVSGALLRIIHNRWSNIWMLKHASKLPQKLPELA